MLTLLAYTPIVLLAGFAYVMVFWAGPYGMASEASGAEWWVGPLVVHLLGIFILWLIWAVEFLCN